VPGGAEPFHALLGALLESLLATDRDADERFGEVLREIFEYGQGHDLHAAFTSDAAVRVLSAACRERGAAGEQVAPTLHDAVSVLRLLEHGLRPLSAPPAQCDLTHVTTNGIAVLPALVASWRHGTPMLLSEHGVYLREHYLHSRTGVHRWPVRALYLSFLRRLCTLGYRQASGIVPCNAWNRRWEERLGADPARIRTVYNGVDPAAFAPCRSEPPVPTIVWVGRIDPMKDIETLLRAVALVRVEMPRARLRLFGAPAPGREPYFARCRRLVAELGIGDAVSFEGRCEDPRAAYSAGHLVVLCSISEGLPYTVLEAMSCGRPCVVTDVGGVGEAAAGAGVLVPPRDAPALARACLRLLDDHRLRQELGERARARVLARFTLDRMIAAYAEIYRAVGSGRLLRGEARDTLPATGPSPAFEVQPATGPPPARPLVGSLDPLGGERSEPAASPAGDRLAGLVGAGG
jgi:glycosyltransferase involved in cell wall biosynthesis